VKALSPAEQAEPEQHVVSLYEQVLARRGFTSDPAQWRAVGRLRRLYEEWSAYKARRSTAVERAARGP
jgi:cell division protein ZapE